MLWEAGADCATDTPTTRFLRDTSVILTVAALGLLSWLVLVASPWHRWPTELQLRPFDISSETGAAADFSPKRLAVIVPARDEATTLPVSLPSLEAQAPGRIWVADDGSRDETAAVAGAIVGAEHVLPCPPRPDGWSGKVHALAFAVKRVCVSEPDVEWLLLTDADIRHRPGSIASLQQVASEGFDLVSVMARLNATSFWEKLLVPPFVYFFHLLYPFRAVSSGSSGVAAAAGGCLYLRREALERGGGLAAIADALIDDVALGRTIKRSGGRIWLGFDPGIVSIRRYGLGDLWRMVARNAFVQLGFSWLLLLGVVLSMGVVFVAPPLLTVVGALGLIVTDGQMSLDLPGSLWPFGEGGERTGAGLVFCCGLGAWLLQALMLLPFVKHHRVSPMFAWSLPVASLFYLAMTVSSAINHLRGRTSSWRGRIYEA